jgi:cytochrome c oxidase subunit IV
LPITALFFIAALLVTAVIFLITFERRGLVKAILVSTLSMLVFSAIFFAFLTISLNYM